MNNEKPETPEPATRFETGWVVAAVLGSAVVLTAIRGDDLADFPRCLGYAGMGASILLTASAKSVKEGVEHMPALGLCTLGLAVPLIVAIFGGDFLVAENWGVSLCGPGAFIYSIFISHRRNTRSELGMAHHERHRNGAALEHMSRGVGQADPSIILVPRSGVPPSIRRSTHSALE